MSKKLWASEHRQSRSMQAGNVLFTVVAGGALWVAWRFFGVAAWICWMLFAFAALGLVIDSINLIYTTFKLRRPSS